MLTGGLARKKGGAGHRLITNHPFITGEGGWGGSGREGGRGGAKQPLVRLSWSVNQAGLDYHIWTTLLQPKACSSFASVDKNKKKRKGHVDCALSPC